jgi:cytochrome P450
MISHQRGNTNSTQTIVGIYHWAMFRNPDYFTNAEQFVPERWLGDVTYKNDNRGVVRPFSYGPRNCIGRKYDSPKFLLSLLCDMPRRKRSS